MSDEGWSLHGEYYLEVIVHLSLCQPLPSYMLKGQIKQIACTHLEVIKRCQNICRKLTLLVHVHHAVDSLVKHVNGGLLQSFHLKGLDSLHTKKQMQFIAVGH